jgi:DNA-binding LacI/PurR family transcriptional regulator
MRDNPVVNKKTADRIRRIAKEAGFTANEVARSLVTQKTNMIGVVVTVLSDPFHHEIIAGLDQIANENGYSVIIADSQGDPERELSVVRSFHARRVDAIVVMSSRVGARYMSQLSGRAIPIVLVNNQRHEGFVHSVTIDNIVGALEAVRHLTGLGHTRIAYIGNKNRVYSNSERLLGYRQALDEAGIRYNPRFVVHSEFSPDGGMAAMNRLLTLRPAPTAVFCYNDMLALGVLTGTEKIAQVPQDLSVVGFDDLFFSRYLRPPLTTILQPKFEMGKTAMQLALNLVAGEKAEGIIKVKPRLIVRESTGPAPDAAAAPTRQRESAGRNLPMRTADCG